MLVDGRVSLAAANSPADIPSLDDLRALFDGPPICGPSVYDLTRRMNIDYGEAFRGIQQLWVREHEVFARVELPSAAGSPSSRSASRIV